MSRYKEKIADGMMWSFLERFSSQGISTVISIILARHILPDEYGIIAAVTVFTSIATVFVAGGFGSALIHKKNADEVDFSSMFYFNAVFSLVLYGIVYFVAPILVRILNETYDYENLALVLRVLGVGIIFSSFNSFYRSLLSRDLQFKKIFFVTLGGSLISGVFGVVLAFLGFGVWALVTQNLLSYFLNTVLFVFLSGWHPRLMFSFGRLKPLLIYGGKMMVSSLLTTLYSDVNSLVIGNRHNSDALAYYRKGLTYPKLIVSNIISAINTALFPVMVHMETQEELKNCVRKFNKLSTFVICPLMFGLAAVAPTFVSLLLTDKWLPCVFFLQLSCLNYVLQPIGLANLQYWRASGKATLYLVADILKKVVGVSFLILALLLNGSVESILIAEVLATLIGVIINVVPSGKFLKYSLPEQIKDVLPQFALSLLMFMVVGALGHYWNSSLLLKLIVQILLGMLIYISGAIIMKMTEVNQLIGILKRYVSRQ